MAQEKPSVAPESVLGSIASSVARLRQPLRPAPDRYTPAEYYWTDTGAQLYSLLHRLPEIISSPQAVDRLNQQIKPQAELARTILQGIESPRLEMQQEMRFIAERLSAAIPQAPAERMRRQQQKELEARQADAFGESMVVLLEEMINGLDQRGTKTPLTVLSRVAQYALSRVPKATIDTFLSRGQDGRLHFSKNELATVTGLRGNKVIAGGINFATGGLLKEGEAPVSAYRGVKAVAGRLGRGLLGSYAQMTNADTGTVAKAQAAHKWLGEHADAFDPKISKALGWGKKANATIRRVADVLDFAEYELPAKLSRGIDAIPVNQQLAKIGELLRGAVGVGVTGLLPLLELRFFKQPSVKN